MSWIFHSLAYQNWERWWLSNHVDPTTVESEASSDSNSSEWLLRAIKQETGIQADNQAILQAYREAFSTVATWYSEHSPHNAELTVWAVSEAIGCYNHLSNPIDGDSPDVSYDLEMPDGVRPLEALELLARVFREGVTCAFYRETYADGECHSPTCEDRRIADLNWVDLVFAGNTAVSDVIEAMRYVYRNFVALCNVDVSLTDATATELTALQQQAGGDFSLLGEYVDSQSPSQQ